MSGNCYSTGAYSERCAHCGKEMAKKDLDRIICKAGRNGSPKTVAYFCRDCMSWMADVLGVELPDMDVVKRWGKPTDKDLKSGPSWLHELEAGTDLAAIQERLYKEGS